MKASTFQRAQNGLRVIPGDWRVSAGEVRLVHQTAMFHEDRLGGAGFTRVWLCGGALASGQAASTVADLQARLGMPVEAVDVRPAAALGPQLTASPELLDVLAASVGVLIRDRKAA